MVGMPKKPATNCVAGSIVDLERSAELLDPPLAHDDDAVGHRHRLGLVVRHVDEGRLQPLVQPLELGAHVDPELGVEARERLVH